MPFCIIRRNKSTTMSILNCVIITLMFHLQEVLSKTLSSDPISAEVNEESHGLNFVPHKLLQSPTFYNQQSSHNEQPLGVTEVEVKVVTGIESLINHLDLTDFIEELFEPQIPLSSEEEYVPFVNGTPNLQVNCTQLNSTVNCDEQILHSPTLDQTTIIKVVILSVISIFSYAGNIATQASILRTGRQNTSTVYMLLIQLTIADLLVTTFCILTDAVWMLTVQWYGGNFLCKVVKFMQMFSLYLSTYVLVLIGFDRLCAVRWPMGRARAKKDVRKGIVVIWMLSALFSMPQAAIFSVMRGPFVEEFFQCVTYAFYTAVWQEQFYTMVTLVLMFLLPLIILIATYITTFVTIASQENMFSERPNRSAIADARSKILQKAKVKSLMITVVIVLAFVLCWTPYYVTMIASIFLDAKTGMTLQNVVFFFGSSTAAINPLIYGAFHLKRKRRKPRSSKSTSLNNNSSSSRLETSLMTTFRKTRRSREEANGGRMELWNHPTCHYVNHKNHSTTVEQTGSLLV